MTNSHANALVVSSVVQLFRINLPAINLFCFLFFAAQNLWSSDVPPVRQADQNGKLWQIIRNILTFHKPPIVNI